MEVGAWGMSSLDGPPWFVLAETLPVGAELACPGGGLACWHTQSCGRGRPQPSHQFLTRGFPPQLDVISHLP